MPSKGEGSRAGKPWYERRWAQAPLGVLVLFYLGAILLFDNFDYRLLWATSPLALLLSALVAARAPELRGDLIAQAMAALMLAPFISAALWVPANVLNGFEKRDPRVHAATVTEAGKSFFGSGRSSDRYVITVKLDGSDKTLGFGGLLSPSATGEKIRVCEWTGLLGYPAYTLHGC